MRRDRALLGNDLIYLDQEALAAGLLRGAAVLAIGEGHLFHSD